MIACGDNFLMFETHQRIIYLSMYTLCSVFLVQLLLLQGASCIQTMLLINRVSQNYVNALQHMWHNHYNFKRIIGI